MVSRWWWVIASSHDVTCSYCLLVLLDGSLDVINVEEVIPGLTDRLGVLHSKGARVTLQKTSLYPNFPTVFAACPPHLWHERRRLVIVGASALGAVVGGRAGFLLGGGLSR